MEMRARYALVGAFVLAVVAALLGFIYWIQNTGGLRQPAYYEIRFDEPVSGLLKGSTVLFNGIRVGEVAELRLSPDQPQLVTARIALSSSVVVRADTIADIDYQGLIGTPAIALRGGSPTAPRLTGTAQSPPRIAAKPAAGRTLTQAAREALTRVDTLLADNAGPVTNTIANLKTFAEVLSRNSERIDGILAGLERMTGGGASKAAAPTYDLVAPTAFPAVDKKPRRLIAVAEPAALLMFDSQKVLMRGGDGAFSSVENAQWSDNLPKLLQAKIIQTFENADLVQSVNRQSDDTTADFRVAINIRNFQISAGPDKSADGEVEFAARLFDPRGQIVDGRLFRASVPVGGTDATMAISALNKAFAKTAVELVTWVTGLM